MKSVEQQQPSSMDSSDSVNGGGSEYAYRPLTTKHRRAGSTGTTGDEEYTTDEDELYPDEADCAGISLHSTNPISKSDLARAATDLFGYSKRNDDENDQPTSLFEDDDDTKFKIESGKSSTSMFTYDNKLTTNIACSSKYRNSTSIDKIKKPTNTINDLQKINNNMENKLFKLDNNVVETMPLDLRLDNELVNDKILPMSFESSSIIIKDKNKIDDNSMREINDDGPPSPTTLQWEKAVAEVKEHAITKLQEELKRAHEELKLKDEEVTRLSRFRQDVETEVEELTASLFQEAHNMVKEANIRQATAERLLEESRMKVEVLAAEVIALKTLVLTSTPARPNPHLHPQIDTRCRSNNNDESQGGLFSKKYRPSPTNINHKNTRELSSPPESPQKEQKQMKINEKIMLNDKYCTEQTIRDKDCDRNDEREQRDKDKDKDIKDLGIEVDPRIHCEFLRWKENPCIDMNNKFISRIFHEDIDLCLDFPNIELGEKVRQAVLDGIIFIEAISDKKKTLFPKKCVLLDAARQCHYRMRLGDDENQWHSISQICRNRIIAVCDFLNYLRYVERGLVKSSVHDIYWEITRLRKEMVLARLGLALSS
ncbi:guanine nucleotide exchange factor for Rab-3A-like isoform X2 [Aphidius gifuensis]|uniref:guanine nucleotide exchange factor for Rab-3A-like isoform X2 n=1 Tax=Aphidius gifuensis TaxID=684658 RepID=UPI001CDD5D75|nr:guanine nucleotide exchange factor for Rab-3A-like isoform X2 [Aphidius gifuensis]